MLNKTCLIDLIKYKALRSQDLTSETKHLSVIKTVSQLCVYIALFSRSWTCSLDKFKQSKQCN